MTFSLIYHDVAPNGDKEHYGFPGPAAARYKLTPAGFEEHLDAIAAAGVDVGFAADHCQAALTFDDGGASALWIADALERRGWRGHYFITTGRIGSPGFVGVDEIGELVRRGHVVGSHSHSHPTYMGALSPDEIAREWGRSRDTLGEIVGAAPATAAVPGGFVSPTVIAEAARAGYRVLMTSRPSARATWHDGIEVHGRYTVWASTSPARAAAYARGGRLARASLWIAWEAKSAPKRLSPTLYELVRQRWARSRPITTRKTG
jgi:peptidoglycan/xylan/chitin deacetylase (PgdA/CDA1 family)